MHPERAARLLAILGIYFLLAVLGLRASSIALAYTQDPGGAARAPFQPYTPSLGNYLIASDGKEVLFEQQVDSKGNTGWFRMALDGGPVAPADAPQENLDPFAVKDGQVYLKAADSSFSLVGGILENATIASYALSPDGKALAFSAYKKGNPWGLYILYPNNRLEWLGDHDSIHDLAWSPDGKNVAFTAPVHGTDQIFRVDSTGQLERQLTTDSTRKSSPRWSPDGTQIAYLAHNQAAPFSAGEAVVTPQRRFGPTPTPRQTPPAQVLSSINLIDANGDHPRRWLEDRQMKFNLAWGISGSTTVLTYAQNLVDHPQTTHLYALDPHTGQVRRVYPYLEILALVCPDKIPAGKAGTVQFGLINTSPLAVKAPVLMRASAKPFPSVGKVNTNVVRSETIQIAPGSSQVVTWQVQSVDGLVTYLSVLLDPGKALPLSEKRCFAENSYYGLPNLSHLSLSLLLMIPGMILFLPLLRQQKRAWMWALYLFFPLLVIGIILFEARLVGW